MWTTTHKVLGSISTTVKINNGNDSQLDKFLNLSLTYETHENLILLIFQLLSYHMPCLESAAGCSYLAA